MEVGYVEEFEHGDFDRFCFGGGSNGYFVDDLRSLDDFVRRGRGEYLGTQPLTEAMIEVQETKDYRKKT
jgi:hypothetical protein